MNCSKNVDFNYSSTRFYIKDGVLYAGPLWDLDLSGGNANPVNYPTYFENGDSSKGLWCQQFTWFKNLWKMPEFYNMVSERYKSGIRTYFKYDLWKYRQFN